ncbi:helix-turn-helix domain-containing protein [Streptomyces hygroscopicus]|uniref:helix-turn-helix domain-containing protein n=1 Tax=Streptomyces hygroscopicus TaxID=1912 RepID=UPI000767CDDE|nr:helix-turn-helix domain-containing protein [Streptomyces hygroscopicus]GLV78356.1 transcriptional regulator [Streptomyces hygroscopicus subsp. hygroscopicus]
MDSTAPGAASGAFDAFRREWETQIGDGFRLPTFSPATMADFRSRSRAFRVGDAAVTDFYSESVLRTDGPVVRVEDQVRLYVVRRGAWRLDGSSDRGAHSVSAGQFHLRHVGRPTLFETAPHTVAKVVVLPSAMLKPLIGKRTFTGPVDSAEVRLLTAHTNMLHSVVGDLGPAGVQAAHSILIELAKAVVRSRFDDVEPLLAPALAQAAKDLAEDRLTDPDLSPAMLAGALNVSLRTLQRAFATVGESVASYIRHRRLEEARAALAAPVGRPSVSELAAHWQFADSSHFIRAFKKHYGQTPTEYVRSLRPDSERPGTP